MGNINSACNTKYRKTPQGIAVLKSLKKLHSHPTANEIHQDVIKQFPNLSLATVYNNLKKMDEDQIIQEVHVKNGPNRFDQNPSTHYHIICNDCGIIQDLSYPLLNEIEHFASNLYDFVISNHEFNLYGLCKECQNKNQEHRVHL